MGSILISSLFFVGGTYHRAKLWAENANHRWYMLISSRMHHLNIPSLSGASYLLLVNLRFPGLGCAQNGLSLRISKPSPAELLAEAGSETCEAEAEAEAEVNGGEDLGTLA